MNETEAVSRPGESGAPIGEAAKVLASPLAGTPVSRPSAGTWDEDSQTWVYKDPETDILYEWHASLQCYLPRIDEEDLKKQQEVYYRQQPVESEKSEDNEPQSNSSSLLLNLGGTQKYRRDRGVNRIIEDEDGTKYVQKKVNNSLYVTNLPLDLTEEEYIAFFSKVGILKKDLETGQTKIKMYRDEQGKFKGDALVTYFRPESVSQAFLLLDGAEIRPGYPIKLEEAKFKIENEEILKNVRKKRGKKRKKSETVATTSESADGSGRSRENEEHPPPSSFLPIPPKRKRRLYNQQNELSWEEQEQKHVILKRMFRVSDAIQSPYFYEELKEEVKTEASKFGKVESVKVFENSPEGVVAIKFSQGEAAEKCVKTMNNRLFDGIRISAEFYDGFTNYAVEENEEDRKLREEKWEEWLAAEKQS